MDKDRSKFSIISDESIRNEYYRIDTIEIEQKLLSFKEIEQCAVVEYQYDMDHYSYEVVAYVVSEEILLLDKILDKLNLPANMMPTILIQLSSFPLNKYGFIDREILRNADIDDIFKFNSMKLELENDNNINEFYILAKERLEENEYIYINDIMPKKRTYDDNGKNGIGNANKEFDKDVAMAIVDGGKLNEDIDKGLTLLDVFRNTLENCGNDGIHYYDVEGNSFFQSYKELSIISSRILAGLREKGIRPKDKLIFQFSHCSDFIEMFWACVLGGIVPIPLNLSKTLNPDSNEGKLLHSIYNITDGPFIATSDDIYDEFTDMCKALRVDNEKIINILDIKNNEVASDYYYADPDDTAIIFFTSGSTGIPKGVIQTHRAIILRERGVIQLNKFEKDVSLNWMPLEHVGGVLMAHMRSMILGSTQVQVRTEYILIDTLRWLDLIDKHKVNYTWSPHFAYALINDRIESSPNRIWNLSSMNFMLNGGEAINSKSGKKFIKLLRKFGLPESAMHPAWGMSETCSGTIYSDKFTSEDETGVQIIKNISDDGMVSMSSLNKDSIILTEIGVPIPGITVRIVDTNNEIVQEDMVGRVQVKGEAITNGYYKNEEINQQVFTEDGWFDTGDLGFIHNGRVTLTGRTKDIIIINGLNYNNVEIEAIIDDIKEVDTSYTAVCSVREPESNSDKVVVFFVPLSDDIEQILSIRKKIIENVSEKIGLSIDYVVPVSRADIPKTSIGKIQRTKLSRLFMLGEYENIIREIELRIGSDNTVPQWFVTKNWSKYEELYTDGSIVDRVYLVFKDQIGLCSNLIDRMRKQNINVITVEYNNYYKKDDDGNYLLDFSIYNHFLELKEDLYKRNVKLDCIIYAGSYTKHVSTIDEFNMAQQYGFNGLLNLGKLLSNESDVKIKLFTLTNQLNHILKDEITNYSMGNIAGFMRCFEVENNNIECSHIDLGNDSIDNNCECILNELKNSKLQREVAYRKSDRYILGLKKIRALEEIKEKQRFISGGLYVVTGGLGGIGTEISKYLLNYYNAKLIIIGRTPIIGRYNMTDELNEDISQNRKVKNLKALLKLSSDVVYEACNVSDEADLADIIEKYEERFKQKLNGIIHTAGEGNLKEHWENVDTRWIKNVSQKTFENMNDAKIYGSLALYNIANKRQNIDLILCSSTNSYFGSATFSAYSSANSFVDYLVEHAKSKEQDNIRCFNFSSWGNVGMSDGSSFGALGNKKGLFDISIKRGIASIEIANRLDYNQVFIGVDITKRFTSKHLIDKEKVNIDFYTYVSMNNIEESLETIDVVKNNPKIHWIKLNEIPKKDDGTVNIEQLYVIEDDSAEAENLETETEKKLAEIWCDILKVQEVCPSDDFFHLGGQSLKATKLARRIRNDFSIQIKLKKIFDICVLRDLAIEIDRLQEEKAS
ncbi:SDR family NAD(P)-dependent oxidoreductase [Wukongibacter sp. M2B1]|uniref:SDR family NAD(P)-dependent oxidoreductase n=1 Tax=Wukongibacter sp. M2B1 TaxID=3088895 RepID=UPI003D799BE1|nr:NRPS [Wukongibacter baidiensis]